MITKLIADYLRKKETKKVDTIAILLLKDFIFSQFPNSHPERQVEAAYLYAKLMADQSDKVEGQTPNPAAE